MEKRLTIEGPDGETLFEPWGYRGLMIQGSKAVNKAKARRYYAKTPVPPRYSDGSGFIFLGWLKRYRRWIAVWVSDDMVDEDYWNTD